MTRPVLLLLAALTAFAAPLRAARVDTLAVPSAAMGRTVTVVVAVPSAAGRFPAVVLLHGAGGGYANWPRRLDALGAGFGALADRYGLVLAAPDGGADSWYLDSPRDPSVRMETFVAEELPAWMDAHLPTLPERRYRAVTGLSMGGHGALMLALRHPGVFGAASSISGGVDLAAFPERWGKARHLGPYDADTLGWNAVSVYQLVRDRPAPDPLPALLVDCGTDDFFLPINRRLHALLTERQLAHDYTERPGGHAWTYWTRALPYHLAFFRETFDRG